MNPPPEKPTPVAAGCLLSLLIMLAAGCVVLIMLSGAL